jgi:hypothetical protein
VSVSTPLLHLDIFSDAGLVVFEAADEDGSIALPLAPQVARAIAVSLMVAADEAEGVGAS